MNAPRARVYAQGGQGPTLVLVHGFGADRYSWAATAPALTCAAAVWAVDLPGHGAATDEVGAGDPSALAAALARGIEDLPGPVVIVGHSLGGAVALHLAALDPGRVRRLVLIAPVGVGGAVLDHDFLASFPELASPEATQPLLERLVERKRLIVPAMVAHVLANLDRPERRQALRQIAGTLARAEAPPTPATIPVDLIWGDADAINPPPDAPGFNPKSNLVIPGVGHLPHVEAAAKVNRVIRAALSD